VGLGWSSDRESNPGGNIATGRALHVGQVKGENPNKKGIHRSSGWGLGVVLNPNHKKYVLLKGF